MDDNRAITVCIILVNEDVTCTNIVKEMLRACSYEVLRTGGALDVFHAIWEKKGGLDLVLTNADKLESNGTEIFEHIQKTLRLPVNPISLDKRKIGSKGQSFSFSAYILYGLSKNGVKELWEIALRTKKDKMVAAHQEESVEIVSIPNIAVETNKASSLINDAAHPNQNPKGVELIVGGSKEDHPTSKKPRVVWTIEMHKKFLEAIEIIGYENAVPKKIVEVMNIPGLTRENVASHLQKYRGSMKRTQETVFSPFKPHYLNTHEDCVLGEGKNCTSLGGLLFSDRSQADKLQQKHVPKLHFTPNYTTYIDQKRNMLLSIDNNRLSDNSSHLSNFGTFVGYRFTSDGQSVEYGNSKASFQGQSLAACQEPALRSSNGDFANEEDTEKCLSFLDQNTSLQSREAPGNDLFVQCPVAFFEGIPEQHFSPPPLMPQMLQCLDEFFDQSGDDDAVVKGTGSTSYQFDLEEFDDTIFSPDD